LYIYAAKGRHPLREANRKTSENSSASHQLQEHLLKVDDYHVARRKKKELSSYAAKKVRRKLRWQPHPRKKKLRRGQTRKLPGERGEGREELLACEKGKLRQLKAYQLQNYFSLVPSVKTYLR